MKYKVYIIMGVSGCGKSTIGKLLAKELQIPFFDGDDYHSKANVSKMASGNPLNDEDRKDWLLNLNDLALKHVEHGAIIACSALKEKYRTLLRKNITTKMTFVYLKGTFDEIYTRLNQRKGHYMPLYLLKSQFEILEAPKDALHISINKSPEEIVDEIVKHIK